MMALPSCRLSSAINYTLLSQQERCSLSPDVRTQTNARAHRGHRGTDTCRVFVTSSVDICDRMALWERRPSVVGKAGLEGDKGARCITLLFSVGLSCVKCCAVTAHGVCCFRSYWCYSSEIIQQQINFLFKLLSFLLLLLNRLQLPLHSCCWNLKVTGASLVGITTFFSRNSTCVLITQKQCPVKNVLDSLKPHLMVAFCQIVLPPNYLGNV